MSKHLDFAIETAKQAGALIMEHHDKMHTLEWKLRTNFKTKMDDASELLIRRAIHESFPHHSIMGEEFAAKKGESEYTWVVDPLDGTIPYTRGYSDHFSVCLGLCQGQTPILGVIFAPKREELYAAELGRGVTLNEKPIRVASDSDINHSVVGADDGKLDRNRLIPYIRRLKAEAGVIATLSFGCASVPLCLVACGKMDAYLAMSLEPWDMAAAAVIVREAGGKVTNVHGKEWQLSDASIIAANHALHKNLLRFFNNIDLDPC